MGYNDIWQVGDPIGTGNNIGAPEVPYMSYGPKPKEIESEWERAEREKREEEQRQIRELKPGSGGYVMRPRYYMTCKEMMRRWFS